MFNKIKILSMTACAAFLLQSCHSDDDALYDISTPQEIAQIDSTVYEGLRRADVASLTLQGKTQDEIDEAVGKAEQIDGLFKLAAVAAGRVNPLLPPADPALDDIGTEPCSVKLHKMTYNTVGGAGEATNSTGVMMVPYSDVAESVCNDPKPVVLYAHGTNADRDYDLSKIITDPSNAANQEGMIMLAMYAAEGYVVVAPNYAGYADSSLQYHPYVNEVQQSTEMIDALNYAKTYASEIGVDLSSELFVTGLSQGGYVAMATHKALQAKGEAVTASVPVSGPYIVSDYLDKIMQGYVNFGATTFAPMYLTSLDRTHNIYGENPSDVFAVDGMDNVFPNPGADDDGIPAFALFSENSQPVRPTSDTSVFPFGGFPLGYAGQDGATFIGLDFDTNHLLTDTFRTDFLESNPGTIGMEVRELAEAGDLDNWDPQSDTIMCGSSKDATVYYSENTASLATKWAQNDKVSSFDLEAPATAQDLNAFILGAWADSGALLEDIHATTGAYCAAIALIKFNSL